MTGIHKGDKGFMSMHMPERKKPCLAIKEGNVFTKVASFNNEESAEWFMNFVAEMFNVKEREQ